MECYSGAGVGAAIGAVPGAIALLAGLLKKRRSAEDHADYLANLPATKNFLIPGVGAYNLGRRARQKLEAKLGY